MDLGVEDRERMNRPGGRFTFHGRRGLSGRRNGLSGASSDAGGDVQGPVSKVLISQVAQVGIGEADQFGPGR